jgi:nucleoside-diphosphate-sugar epimerase
LSNILITGSNGFICKAIVKKLSGMGYKTIGFDVADGDIAEEGALSSLENKNISYVFHLAGKTFVPESWSEPFSFYRTNIMGTENVLEFCRKTEAGLTYVSSYLYGKPEYLPIDENHPLKAYNPYSHSKLIAEEICCYYKDQFHVGVSILRPFNVYGPGQSGQFLIPEMIMKMLDPGTSFIEVMDLRPKRDYVFVDDFTEALYLSMDGPRVIYNIGSGYSLSVEQILNEISIISGKEKIIRNKGIERPNEVYDLFADISRISKDLSWKPQVGIRDGLEKCIEWISKH